MTTPKPVTCWFHTVYRIIPVEDGGREPGETITHDFTDAEITRLLELFSSGDWEDGPRCLREILASDEGGELEPRRWLP